MHYSTMPTLPRQRLKLKDLVSEKQKLSVNLVKCHNYYSQYYTTETQLLSVMLHVQTRYFTSHNGNVYCTEDNLPYFG